jgi:hypothetical protein
MSRVSRRKLSKAQMVELEGIRKSNKGLLKGEDVLEFAKDPSTALHKRFEWDDTEAAYRYRLMQAQEIIRVAVTVLPNTNKPVRAYVSLQRDRNSGRGYRATANVLSSENLRQELVDEALDDMEVFKARYRILRELSKVFAEMDRAKKTLAPAKKKRKAG